MSYKILFYSKDINLLCKIFIVLSIAHISCLTCSKQSADRHLYEDLTWTSAILYYMVSPGGVSGKEPVCQRR